MKVIFIGDAGVGKSSIIHRAAQNTFLEFRGPSIGVEFMHINCKNCLLQLWDTAGQERYRSISKAYYRGAVVVSIVFDITSRSSFEHVEAWLAEATLELPEAVLLLIAHKKDLADRVVSTQEAEAYASKHNMFYLEFSAKTGDQQTIVGKLEETADKVLASSN